MTGGGLYAVNKLAKTAENRQSSHQQGSSGNNSRDAAYPPQNNWSPPPFHPQPQNARGMNDTRGGTYPSEDEYWYSAAHNAWYPLPPRGYQSTRDNYNTAARSPRGYVEEEVTPPGYALSQQQQKRVDQPAQRTGNSEQARGWGSPASFQETALGKVMDYARGGS